MYSSNFFQKILIEPAEQGFDELCIISGFASSAMAFSHMQALKEKNLEVKVNLLVGMVSLHGISYGNHRGFQNLCGKNFSCGYLNNGIPIHSKAYVWMKEGTPGIGFIGSANYTQTAFLRRQRELMSETPGQAVYEYFQVIKQETDNCLDLNVQHKIGQVTYAPVETMTQNEETKEANILFTTGDLQYVDLLLINNDGEVSAKSCLNWGQRKDREHNQAYLPIPATIYHTDFFPERSVHFTVLTDDGEVFVCTRAQDNGKAIHTPHNNSIIGKYFRKRLGVKFGEPVTKNHLDEYGRTFVRFYKFDDENYYLDFSR